MRYIVLGVGALLLLLGLVSMVTPIPGGTLLIATGGGLVICTSETASRRVQACRRRFGRFNSVITWIENKIGERISAPLRRTRPDETNAD